MSLAIVKPELYQQELNKKVKRIQSDFACLEIPELEIHPSLADSYRMRAEFRIWHDHDGSYYRMFDQKSGEPFNLTDFPAGSSRIRQLMQPLLAAIHQCSDLRHRLFQMEYLTTLSGEALITLIYHRNLDDAWQEAAGKLARQFDIALIGRSKGHRRVLSRDYVTETLMVNNRPYQYRQVENSFTQPNARVNEKMLTWAFCACEGVTGDLLELYCGNGNFTCVLAEQFNRVLATEISKISVASAHHNFALNRVSNVEIARLSSEELTQAMNHVRPFFRLRSIDLDSYHFSTVFIDPPRAGLDPETLGLVQRLDRVVYISCNPETLKKNLSTLVKSHRIQKMALFDQFPYTHHAEMGVLLERR
ncbi:tRNA/tmRNA (uracil-C(5))-methyltransferase [invertebrate metagenome]|uniref:tRNA/tmRNA (Uracil-C(5))-methyltransferase n=1 Tax=invertebrate metagenome TaxID=1711999 RepID=A0A2H9TCC6_9ZZZZ